MPYEVGQKVQIIYSSKDPTVILTRQEFPKFRTDFQLLMGTFAIMLSCLIILFFQMKSY